MLTGEPDRALGLSRFEMEMQNFRSEASGKSRWVFRERYIDRGTLDPYYIIQFKDHVDDLGDDLYDQELFVTRHAGLRGVCMTRERQGAGFQYWREIDSDTLDFRLERFLQMFREDYLQPPGAKGDLHNPQHQHETFAKKRFLFEIRSGTHGIIGVGPKMYAGVGDIGAVCGQVTDENGNPLDGVEIQIADQKETYTRTTASGGLFWFSKIPQGKYMLKVKGRSCVVQILRHEQFGNIKGWFTDQDGLPVKGGVLQFSAPDGEIFNAWSNPSGKFTTGPLPAYPVQDSPLSRYPYLLSIPEFQFSVTKTVYVKDAILSGVLRSNNGVVLPDETILLKQKGVELARTNTDDQGNFRFFELEGGTYELELPGQKIFLSWLSPGRVIGKEPDGIVNQTRIELVADGKVITTERLSREKKFSFDGVAPGKYVVGVK